LRSVFRGDPVLSPPGRRKRPAQRRVQNFSSVELLHLLGKHPQRPIQSHAPVNAGDLASADAPALSAAARQTTLQAVLLHPLEGKPEAVAPVFYAARRVELLGRNGRRRLTLRALTVAKRQRGRRERPLLPALRYRNGGNPTCRRRSARAAVLGARTARQPKNQCGRSRQRSNGRQ